MTLVIRDVNLIDGTGASVQKHVDVTIEDSTIARIASAAGRPTPAEVIDGAGLTLLPGLIDAHTHLGGVSLVPDSHLSAAELAAQIFENAAFAIQAGFTTCREVGGIDGGVKKAINRGLIAGPRMLVAGPALAQDGGHATFMPEYSDCFCHMAIPGLAQFAEVCNGPDSVRLAARQAFRRGADHLKIMASGGVVSATDAIEDTQLSIGEISAAVEEAAARGTYVTAHAHSLRGVQQAVRGGVSCIEHGTFIDEETAAEMASRHVNLVSTLTVIHLMADEYDNWGLPATVVPRLGGIGEGLRNAIKLANAAGVRVGSGSDLLGPRQNRRGLELTLRAQVEGPIAAIVAATRINAEILGLGERLGTVEAGKMADLVLLDGDPLSDPGIFDQPEKVVVVIKAGHVEKNLLSPYGRQTPSLSRTGIADPQID